MILQIAAGTRSLNAHHPEWWVAGVAGVAWGIMALGVWPMAGAGHAHLHAHLEVASDYEGRYAHWMLMVAAMMLPLVLESARIAAVRSFWRRRHRSIALFMAGYLAVWVLSGLVVALLPPSPLLAGVALILAAAWYMAPAKRRLRLACHLTIPMAPRGWRADRSCLSFGWKIGVRCAGNCGILMVACAGLGHAVAGMVGIGALVLAERVRPVNPRIIAGVLAFIGVAIMLGALEPALF